ncbi:MAG: hypothetical protein ABIH11_02610 [Candidatus Altiarchaeota archaeon]
MMKTPVWEPRVVELDVGYANRLLGLELTSGEVGEYLERMRFGVEVKGSVLKVKVPAFRADILHPIDLVEDIAIAYGYMNFKTSIPGISTLGKADELELFSERIRELMVGYGFMEVMTLIMTNKHELFEKMGFPDEEVAEAVNPVSSDHSVARTWLMPSLMNVLEKNRSREYPQMLFEVGDCVKADGSQERKVAGVLAHSRSSFSEVKSVVSGLMVELGGECDVKACVHGSFIDGRAAEIGSGFFGELKPGVLDAFGLEVPVSAFEISLNRAIK